MSDVPKKKIKIPIGGIGFFLIIALIVLFITCTTKVDPGYEGVVINSLAGGVQPEAMTPGLHWKLPFIEHVVQMETRVQKFEASAASSSKDQQDVTAEIAVNYQIMRGATPQIYTLAYTNYEDRVIKSVVLDSTKAATAQFTAPELTSKRDLLAQNIKERTSQKLEKYNIAVDDVLINNLSYSPEYSAAIEAKQVADQKAQQAERDLQRIRIEAQQKEVSAQATANATRYQADADAYNIQKLGDAINKNPDVAKLKWIEKWDGSMPFYMMGSDSNSAMLFTANQ